MMHDSDYPAHTGDGVSAAPGRHAPLRERLKTETRPEHTALEAALDLLRPGFTLTDYCLLVAQFYRFHHAFDTYITEKAEQGWGAAAFYVDGRMKTEWLRQDLAALDMQCPSFCEKTYRALTLALPQPSSLWGAVYTIEGSCLGGVLLCRHFSHALRIEHTQGLRYYTGYGRETGRKWKETLEALASHKESAAEPDKVIEGARQLFRLLKNHLVSLPHREC